MISKQIILGLLLSFSPIFEIRAGIPLIIEYSVRNSLVFWPYVLLAVILNIIVIGVLFFFLDFLHVHLLKFKVYKKIVGKFLNKLHKKKKKIENSMDRWGYFALIAFVALPIPGSGAWSGTIVAWMLGLDRKKSIVSISIGVVLASLLVILLSFGIITSFY